MQTRHPQQYAQHKGETSGAVDMDTPATTPADSPPTGSAQQTLRDVIARKKGYKEGGPKKQQLDNLLMKIIVMDLQPMSIVEDKGFRRFVPWA